MHVKPENGATEWIDPDDAPELDDAFFDNGIYEVGGVRVDPPPRKAGRPRSPRPKILTGVRLDADVLDHFKAQGPGWQTRINATLRAAMERERAA